VRPVGREQCLDTRTSRRPGWSGIALTLLSVILVVPGCSESGPGTPTTPSPIGPGTGPVHYTALAASDGVGYGGSVVCPPLADCPEGTGYVQAIARRLRQTREVTVTNLSLPGGVLSPDVEQLGTTLGRRPPGNLLERGAPFVPRQTTLVTVFIGGNDANTIATGAAAQGGDPRAFITAQVQGFARDFGRLLDTVRGRAPGAQVVVINLPNFAGLPFTQGMSAAERRIIQDVSVRLTTEAINPQASRVTVVDLMCDARAYVGGNYSPDGFHPSDSGYAFLADLVWAAIQAGTGAPGPAPACGFMQIM
jgi:lysophospholipase L1-like esterase